jgi:hypothetical protein
MTYKIEIDESTIDKIVRDRLLSDYDMIDGDIKKLQSLGDELKEYHKIDLADMCKWRDLLKGLLEYYMIPSEYDKKFS